MNIRGDLKILRDLIVKTAANNADVDKILVAASADGVVKWSNFRAPLVVASRTYEKGSFVIDSAENLFMAVTDVAVGGNLTSSDWVPITGGGSGTGGSGGVEEYETLTEFPAAGEEATIYIATITGTLYRWNTVLKKYEALGGIQKDLMASIAVGGISANEVIPAGTDLEKFINKLINPTLQPTRTLNHLGVSGVAAAVKEVGGTYTATLTAQYSAGVIHSKDGSPDIPLTGAVTATSYGGSGIDASSGAISTKIVKGPTRWTATVNYAAGTGEYKDSDGKPSTIFDAERVAGSKTATSPAVTGVYKAFFDTVASLPTTSDEVRALAGSALLTGTAIHTVLKAHIIYYVFVAPATISNVELLDLETNAPLSYETSDITVKDAGGADVAYTLYACKSTGFPSDQRLTITYNK